MSADAAAGTGVRAVVEVLAKALADAGADTVNAIKTARDAIATQLDMDTGVLFPRENQEPSFQSPAVSAMSECLDGT